VRPPSGGRKERREEGGVDVEIEMEVEGADRERRRKKRMGGMRRGGLRWEVMTVRGGGNEQVSVVYFGVRNPLQGQSVPLRV